MTNNYPGEHWKAMTFNFDFPINTRIEVSNFGRVRSFNKISNGNILNGSLTSGYPIIRLKFHKPRDPEIQNHLNFLQEQVNKLAQKLKALKENNGDEAEIQQATELLNTFKKNLSKKFEDDLKSRTVNFHVLIHRLVADYFLTKPSDQHTIVAHLDHDKLNNRAHNLKWMTPEESYKHQKNSPLVIKEKEERRSGRVPSTKSTKLEID
jgi:HNH endonuclease/NUMOD4 motif